MKSLYKKTWLTVVAIAVCLFVSVAFTACFNDSGTKNEEEQYSVTFDAGRGTIFGERFYKTSVKKDSLVPEPSEAPVGEDGFIFAGWNETGSEQDPMWNFATDTATHALYLEAVWVRGYTIRFDANGGTFADGEDTYSILVAQDAKLTAPEITPLDENRVLKGWSDGYKTWDFSVDTVKFQMTLTAQWGWTEEVENALAPFEYRELGDGSCMITGVKDKAVTEFVVPDVVSTIADAAFKDCTELVSAEIADSVSSIGRSAFEGCSALQSVKLPKALTTLHARTFTDCVALEEITLPETLTELGGSAFSGCTALQVAVLPAGITKIESSLFRDCAALTSVEINGAVTKIDEYAFSGCVLLSDFEIPASVTMIYSRAFSDCKSLTSVAVPETCENIDWYAFANCEKLAAVELNCKEIDFGAFSGCKSLASVTLGATVEMIRDGAFEKCGLTSIKIPDTVTTLESAVFGSCAQLESAEIGRGITELSRNLFSGCSALRTVTTLGELKKIGENAFADCVSLLSYTVPATVTEVGGNAFDGCVRLMEVYNLSQAELRGAGWGSYCTVHTDATEESVIDTDATYKLSFCKVKVGNDREPQNYLLDYSGEGQYLTLPDDYKGEKYRLFDYALSFRTNLESVTVSAGVEKIGKNVLFGSDNVRALTVKAENTVYYSGGNCIVEKATEKFVLGCRTSVIPNGVKAIGEYVFCGNATIVNPQFVIPESVTNVERSAFDGCTGLIRTAENLIRYVDKWMIAFVYDEYDQTFDLVLDGGTVGIAEHAMSESYVGKRVVTSFTCNPELKYICDYALYGCEKMTSVVLNDGLLSLGHGAFNSCDSLLEIEIPDSVQSIGAASFMGCDALTYVKLPNGLQEVEYQMFDGCKALETVVIPASVRELGHDVCGNCPKAVVYFEGTDEQWNAVKKGGNSNMGLTVRYYSETEKAGCWHYGADGKPAMWN